MTVKVSANNINLELWRGLYDVAGRVRDLAPWKWMNEPDIFGVEISAGQVAFVSVMGAAGEHYAVSVYPGAAALTSLWRLYEDDDAEPERVLEIPQVQLSFEDRVYLTNEDRRIAKRLGLAFRGKNGWPMFRSCRPGFAPWFIDTDEAEMLLAALTQLLEIAPRQRTDPALIRRRGAWEYLVRACRAAGVRDEWVDEVREILPDRSATHHAVLTSDHVRQWRALPVMHTGIEADFFLMRTPIHERNERPYYPYMLLLVEAQDGLIAGQEMLTVAESLSQMCASVPGKIVEGFARLGLRPSWLTVRPGRLEAILRPVSEALGLELRVQPKLSQLDPAKKTLFHFLAAGPV
jgi:hypothetical protein